MATKKPKPEDELKNLLHGMNAILHQAKECRRHNEQENLHPDAKRVLTQEEIDRSTRHVQRIADLYPHLAQIVGRSVLPYVHLDHRSFSLLDYTALSSYHAKELKNALVFWHHAVKADPKISTDVTDTKKDIKENDTKTKGGNSTKPSASDAPTFKSKHQKKMDSKTTSIVKKPSHPYDNTTPMDSNLMDHVYRNLGYCFSSELSLIKDRLKSKLFSRPIPTMHEMFQVIHNIPWATPRKFPKDWKIYNPSILRVPASFCDEKDNNKDNKDASKYLVILRSTAYRMEFTDPKGKVLEGAGDNRNEGVGVRYRTVKDENKETPSIETRNYLTWLPSVSFESSTIKTQTTPATKSQPTDSKETNPIIKNKKSKKNKSKKGQTVESVAQNTVDTLYEQEASSPGAPTLPIAMPPIIKCSQAQMPYPYPPIAGFEDVRMMYDSVNDEIWAAFTSLENTPDHAPRICLAKLDPNTKTLVGPVVRLIGPEERQLRTEKNWMGFFHRGHLYFVWSVYPLIMVLAADRITGQCKIASLDLNMDPNEWRGSSPMVEVSPETLPPHLQMIHQQTINADQKHTSIETTDTKSSSPINKNPIIQPQVKTKNLASRWFLALVHRSDFPHYCNAFAVFHLKESTHSKFRPFSLQMLARTEPFVFKKHDVEFSCGFEFTNQEDEIVMPYSIHDTLCFCATLKTQSIMNRLAFIDSPDKININKLLVDLY